MAPGVVERRRAGFGWMGLAALLGLTACNQATRKRAPRPRATASASASVVAAPAPSVSAATPDAPPAELVAAFAAWNEATNRADPVALAELYAPRLSLYGRIVSRADALKRKLKYVADHPGFAQTVSQVVWEAQDARRVVRFRKTTSLAQQAATSVDAYLFWREIDGRYRILDEGDVLTARRLEAKLDAQRESWKPEPYACPACSDPEQGDEPPLAGPPLGPDSVKARGQVPPGAPSVIRYGRVVFERFASAVDVPLFLTATPHSANGDGRWFYYDAPPEAGKPPPTPEGPHLLECTIGGFWSDQIPPGAKPDPGHTGDPKISFTTKYEKRDQELYYERYLYGADRVENYVYCSFSPAYEGYFYGIVERMGRSMRAVSGGQAERVPRVSQPFVPFDL
jgi:hypothetical protein